MVGGDLDDLVDLLGHSTLLENRSYQDFSVAGSWRLLPVGPSREMSSVVLCENTLTLAFRDVKI